MTLEAENLHLKAKLSLLEEQFSLLQKTLAAQQHLNALLTQKVKHLEELLAQNSHNSSKPPSSDGFKKPSPRPRLSPRPLKNRSLRKATGKKSESGGQKGHDAHILSQSANPDYLLDHLPSACHACHSDLTRQTPLLVERRQVFEIPLLKLKVSEHRTYQKACLPCKATTIAPFPSEVKQWVQYGSHFRALAVWLNQVQLLPYARTVEVINELFGLVRSVHFHKVLWPLC